MSVQVQQVENSRPETRKVAPKAMDVPSNPQTFKVTLSEAQTGLDCRSSGLSLYLIAEDETF
jgi:hypothetical protein